jgi:hypothetical protein
VQRLWLATSFGRLHRDSFVVMKNRISHELTAFSLSDLWREINVYLEIWDLIKESVDPSATSAPLPSTAAG